jgi:F-type H+-transporting ATPase subunit epsilon
MAEKLKLEMVTPYGEVISQEVDEITAPGILGEFGVLPGHIPMLTALKIGEFSFLKDGKRTYVAVNWGYFEVEEDRISVLVETAEPQDIIDLERAKAAMGKAEKVLEKISQEDKDYRLMEAALQRALNRIQVASRRSGH